jgi:WhiB family redox-sensing transcriptional regulator
MPPLGAVADIGVCPVCCEAYGLRVDGTLRTHGWAQARDGNCPGSRRVPVRGNVVVAGVPQSGDWDQAACRGHDPEWWFSTDFPTMRGAKAICRACRVRAMCLEWALDIGAEHGVFGGLDPAQRKSLARRRARAAS